MGGPTSGLAGQLFVMTTLVVGISETTEVVTTNTGGSATGADDRIISLTLSSILERRPKPAFGQF